MRDKYYSYLREHNLPDVLHDIPELSYSQKLKILERVRSDYDDIIVRLGLNQYHQNYIKKKRVRLEIISNTIKGICERIIIK